MEVTKQYAHYSFDLPNRFPVLLQQLRAKSRASFLESGFPTRKWEQWRAIDIKKLHETAYTLGKYEEISSSKSEVIYSVNGVIAANREHKGVIVRSLSKEGEQFPKELIGSVEKEKGSPFYHLNTALFEDALSLSVKQGNSISKPLQVDYYSTARENASLATHRTVIEVEAGATFDLTQQFVSEGEEELFSNSVTEIILHKGAKLHHRVIQDESKNSHHFHSIFVQQSQESHYEALLLAPGAHLSRTDYQIFLRGTKAQTDLKGLFVGSGQRVHNSDVTIHHQAKECQSSSLFKAIGGDKSHAIFRGLVHVSEDGAGTDARQSYNSLLLTDDARITTEPQLLIYNDDVACSHGATIGQLDEKQLFYLEARGLDPITAKKILIQSFAAEVVSSIENEELKQTLLERVHDEVTNVSSSEGGI